MKVRELVVMLKSDGWELVVTRGSHRQFKHPFKPRRLTVSGNLGDEKECEQACSGDIAQFCKEIQPGGGRILRCLKEREKELSPSCTAKLDMIGKRFQRKGEEK